MNFQETKPGRILLFHPSRRRFPAKNIVLAGSPGNCLSLATTGDFSRVVIVFYSDILRELDALVELCSALNNSSLTHRLQLLAVLPSKHRVLIQKLEFVRITGDAINKEVTPELIREIDETDRIDPVLSSICAFLNYFPVSYRHEIKKCGAYLNRRVLGRPMLSRFCETPDHIFCPYFNDPRSLKDRSSDRRISETKRDVE